MNGYSVLAKYYDRLMSGYDYDGVIAAVIPFCKGKGLDLGTGTGEAAIRLSMAGHAVTAVDISAENLNIAQRKAREKGQKIIFVEGDLAEAEFGDGFGFVTAMCDVFNYITDRKVLKRVFKKVYDALLPGGVFFFDVSAPEKLMATVSEKEFFEDYDDVTYIWSNSEEDGVIDMELTFFVKEGDLYRRFDEFHSLRAYSEAELSELLRAVGFEGVECRESGEEPMNRRLFFKAVKA